MTASTTIETRKEIVAVLNALNNKINEEMHGPDNLYSNARLTTFLSLRSYYMRKLMVISKEMTPPDVMIV